MTGNVLGVNHVSLVVHEHNLDAVADKWERILGLDFEEINSLELGLRMKVDLDAGIELVAPLGSTGAHGALFKKHLDEHGEGFHSIIFRVDNLGEARRAITESGNTVTREIRLRGDEPWFDRYSEFVALAFEPIHGIHASVARIEQIPERRRQPKQRDPGT